jgi:hypothetical protein
LVFVRDFRHGVTVVWRALTEPEQLDLWRRSRLIATPDTGTRLTLRHTAQSEDWLSLVAAGWHICLDVADELLAGRRLGAIRGQEARRYGWDELNDSYESRLGRTTVDGGPVE